MPRSAALRLSTCCVLLPGLLAAQAVPVRTYQKPLWVSADGFTRVVGTRELRSGELLVADGRQNEVWLLSPQGALLRQISRRGEGPAEYNLVAGLVALPGDSTFLVDQNAPHGVLIGPDGKALKSVPYPTGFDKAPRMAGGADTRGRILFPADLWGTEAHPTQPLLRWDRGTGKVDTVTMLVRGVAVTDTSRNAEGSFRISSQTHPYTSSDAWGMTADGGVMVLREKDLHVDWIASSGAVARGPSVNLPRAPLTAAQQQEVRGYGFKQVPATAAAFEPFYAQYGPDRELWLLDTTQPVTTERRYTIIGGTGQITARAVLPKGRMLVAVTATRVYASTRDSDGLFWIEAYPR